MRRVTAGLLLAGLLGLCLGRYGLLDTSTPRFLGAPMLGARRRAARRPGSLLGGRRVQRTRYRPDPWAFAEWATALSGVVAAVAMIVAGSQNAAALNPSIFPLAWPTLPLLPVGRRSCCALAAGGAHAPAADRAARRSRDARRPPRPRRRAEPRSRRSARMIRFEHVTITYADAEQPTLRDVDLDDSRPASCASWSARPASGSRRCSARSTGSSRTSPAASSAGRVTVDGRDTRTHPPRELADVVGVVTQDPLAGCVTDTLEEELAYGMEQLAIAPDVMRKRVEETLDLLGLADLRDRALHQLSAGQLQRVAIGAVLTAHPKVLVLDEPTSALDPTGAEEVLARSRGSCTTSASPS